MKNKTKKIDVIEQNDFARIEIEETKKISLNSLDEDVDSCSKKDLEYRLKFEEKNPEMIKKIKKLLGK